MTKTKRIWFSQIDSSVHAKSYYTTYCLNDFINLIRPQICSNESDSQLE